MEEGKICTVEISRLMRAGSSRVVEHLHQEDGVIGIFALYSAAAVIGVWVYVFGFAVSNQTYDMAKRA